MELAAAVDRQIERLIRAACASVLSLTVVVVVPRQVDGQMIDGGNPIEALDTDLTDCAIPFNELWQRAQSCAGKSVADYSCIRYAAGQFPEVVSIWKWIGEQNVDICTGTLVASDWVLTAAHCIIGDWSTNHVTHDMGKDYVLQPRADEAFVVQATNARLLPEIGANERAVSTGIVYSEYMGKYYTPPYANDLALLRLSVPFEVQKVQPAALAPVGSSEPETTIAGYGVSNRPEAKPNQMGLAWPEPMTKVGDELRFEPTHGAVCYGDSGGPVFARRNRGCKSTDPVHEVRPRQLEAVISYNILKDLNVSAVDSVETKAKACKEATANFLQSLTVAKRHEWICSATNKQASGC